MTTAVEEEEEEEDSRRRGLGEMRERGRNGGEDARKKEKRQAITEAKSKQDNKEPQRSAAVQAEISGKYELILTNCP